MIFVSGYDNIFVNMLQCGQGLRWIAVARIPDIRLPQKKAARTAFWKGTSKNKKKKR